MVAGNINQKNRVYLNDGSGSFTGSDLSADTYSTRSVTLGDVDGDGDLDLVAGNYTQKNRVYPRRRFSTIRSSAGSVTVDTEAGAIAAIALTVVSSLPVNTGIDYYLSNNGGTQWFQVRPGPAFSFPTTGSDLRWRAVLRSLSPVLTPRLNSLRLSSTPLDTDSDGDPDYSDPDDDNDGAPDTSEILNGTDPLDANAWPQPFADVTNTDVAYTDSLVLADADIASGCGGGNFCSGQIATRELAAIWLWKAKNNPMAPPVASGAVYSDVADTDFAADYILGVKNDAITEGCDASNYCPAQALTKDQAARMLLKAAGIASISGASAVYDDVPDGHFAEDWIRGLKVGGYTEGCGGNNYCPDEALTLAGFARLLAKTFNLAL